MTRLGSISVALSLALGVMWPGSAQAIERQRATNWCWAAAIEDVVDEYGVNTTQWEVAARLDGWPRNRPAWREEIVALLDSYGVGSHLVGRPAGARELSRLIGSGGQVIAFVRPFGGRVGHYIVLDDVDALGRVRVSDPWTGLTARQSVAELYLAWKWESSIVVDGPYRKRASGGEVGGFESSFLEEDSGVFEPNFFGEEPEVLDSSLLEEDSDVFEPNFFGEESEVFESSFLEEDSDVFEPDFFGGQEEPRFAATQAPVCFTVYENELQSWWERTCGWAGCMDVLVTGYVSVPYQVCE